MELKEFIKNSLTAIIESVQEVKNTLNDKDSVCPYIKVNVSPESLKDQKIYFDHIQGLHIQKIEFDIAVSAENQNNNGGKAGIKVLGLEANIGGNTNLINSTISRIKFHVPIGFSCKSDSISEK